MGKVFVSRLTLSHFRSHRRAALALDGRPVALFGPNGAGKTNLMEAVSLLSPGRGLRRAQAEEIIRRPEAIGWKVSAEVAGPGVGHDIVLTAEPGQARATQVDGKTAPQVALAKLLRIVWLVPSQDRLWSEGAEGRRRFLDRITLSFLPDHAEAVLSYEKAMRERNRLLRDDARDPAWYRALEAQMAEAAARIVARRADALGRISAAQDGAATAFPVADLGIDGDEAVTADDFAQAFADSRPRDLAAGRTLVGPHRADMTAIYRDKGVPAKQCSTGEQKALLISLILSNARALKAETGNAPLVLLDEVAAHLDAGRRAALFDEICALEAQAWMTGTGPELFEELGERAQHFHVTEDGGESALT
ncbi:DNA replication/repair protein RecF [Rhodobacteraceae bacterium N5(2021)]|uniref:DNA replication and repair protein RecF n=1 Tax=Gymnodinialimonas phycosphaerae TaxID=2841589 RepID=A0A975TSY4_9RHOB|nr:DNA replication/repair protein RecF [Gymnodinialimonas phycosphaerae]MBY4894088.1 DNA replication/repair protein RecF [Gymnodinialimonas phycosphaerae]